MVDFNEKWPLERMVPLREWRPLEKRVALRD